MNAREITEKLKQAGVAEPQAQAVTSVIQECLREAEQADIVSLRQEMAELRVEFSQAMADLKTELAASENRQLLRAILIMILVVLTAIFSYSVKGS